MQARLVLYEDPPWLKYPEKASPDVMGVIKEA